ncbi:hypothetical protein F5050DRAFT_450250 [Lentinula boryana]|uniref:Uncharacterized protein n=1 Tax=Lentinula boryana TaxID=40481 RepID=A0ABQ8Q858_9AGAR|nr:hypothetical protein F5050DRAFT_450250 [Lentinula boryana]
MNPSLPAKPAITNSHGTMNGNKDARSLVLGRETYPPSRDREPSLPGASLPSHPIAEPTPANKYYDPRDTRDARERERDNRDKDYDFQRRRSSSVSASGAEYASLRYGPIRDIRDKDARRDSRDLRRPLDGQYDNASFRREDYLAPTVVDDYRRPPGSTPLQPSFNNHYSRPSPPLDDRYRSEERQSERLPPPPPSQTSLPSPSSYVPHRPDDRERRRYDTQNIYSNYPNHPPNQNHHINHTSSNTHTGITPPTRPTHAQNLLGSRYNENRPHIGESPVAAAALAEREQRERAAAERDQRERAAAEREQREKMERERERLGQREMRPPPLPSPVALAKFDERVSIRAPTLQERLSHPPIGEASRTLSLEERLSSHPAGNSTATTNLSTPLGRPASPASSKGPSSTSGPPNSALSTTSTSAASGTTERLGSAPTPGVGANSTSVPTSAGAGLPAPRNFTPAPSVTRDDGGAARERYSSPTLSERDLERDRRMRTYPSPPPYDRDRDQDHRRIMTNGGSGGPGGVGGGREYVYEERDRDRDRDRERERRRDWPPLGDDPYYRLSSSVPSSSSRPTPSIYPSPPPLPSSQGSSSVVDRYDRDTRDTRNGLRGSWGDHERRASAPGIPSSALANSISTSSPRSDVPPRGAGSNGGGGIPIPIPLLAAPQNLGDDVNRDRDRSYRAPGLDSRYPPLPPSSASGPPASYTHGRVRQRSPSPSPRGPPIKRPRDDMYSPLPPSSSASYSSPPRHGNPPPSGSNVQRRPADYPPPPLPHMSHAQAGREMRDTRAAYYDRYDKYDSRPPAGGTYSSPLPASYDRPRSPPPPPRGAAYTGYRESRDVRDTRDSRDMREVREPRDTRDTRVMRDTRDPREMNDIRDLRDDHRRYSMHPPPLPR